MILPMENNFFMKLFQKNEIEVAEISTTSDTSKIIVIE